MDVKIGRGGYEVYGYIGTLLVIGSSVRTILQVGCRTVFIRSFV